MKAARRLPAHIRRLIMVDERPSSLPAEVLKALKPNRRKYRNVPTTVDGIAFDSGKEAGRYKELVPLYRAGRIADLRIHTRWRLTVDGLEVGVYESDFDYRLVLAARGGGGRTLGDLVVEDVKSDATRDLPLYRIKKALMLAVYGITVQEI